MLCNDFDNCYKNNTPYHGLLTEGCDICMLDENNEGWFYTGDNNWEKY